MPKPSDAPGAALFHTSRLRVRLLCQDDAPALLAIYGDPEVARWLGDETVLSLTLCQLWVAVSQHHHATQGYGLCAVEETHSGELVAGCGVVHRPSADPQRWPAELVYAVRRDRWGRGYAAEAAAPLLRHVQRHAGLACVHATVMPSNRRSLRVLAALGFAWLHTQADPEDDEPVSTWVWPGALPLA
jgi:RimJ/RimL family protein N-acetyltransferase